jgi:hypothetical protein
MNWVERDRRRYCARTIANATNGGIEVTDGDGSASTTTLAMDIHDLASETPVTGDLLAFSDESAAGDPTKSASITAVVGTTAVVKSSFGALGDILVGTGVSTYSALGIGAAATVLTVSGGIPAWLAPSSGVGTSGAASDNAIARFHTDINTIQGSGLEIDDSGNLCDSSANELIEFGVIGSAVNQVKVSNAAAGNGPVIEAEGETNVDLTVKSKGTGQTVVGLVGDIELGDGTLRDLRPNTDEKIDLGSSSYRFNELHVVTITPKTRQTWTPTYSPARRTYTDSTVTLEQLAEALGTLVTDLQALGILA